MPTLPCCAMQYLSFHFKQSKSCTFLCGCPVTADCKRQLLTSSCCAVQYLKLTLDVEQKLHLLMRLANNCELQASDADFSLRERAAGFRQELLVEMVNLEKEVSRKCAACQEVIDAHNPSQPHQGDDMKIVVAPCFRGVLAIWPALWLVA